MQFKTRSAPTDAVDWTAAVHGCSTPYTYTRSADAGGYDSASHWTRPQNDTWPYDAANGIVHILAVYDGCIGVLGAYSSKADDQ